MNREIKFRGKQENSNRWITGCLIQYESGDVAIFEKMMTKYGYEATQITKRTKVNSDTIGQFTGLTDKNGKEIYEGDIVRVPSLDPFGLTEDDALTNSIVSFYRGSFIVPYNGGNHITELLCLKDDEIEVIGNIYDNQDLLEG